MNRRILTGLTILAIAGTLVGTQIGCGRYGRPVRPAAAPTPDAAAATELLRDDVQGGLQDADVV